MRANRSSHLGAYRHLALGLLITFASCQPADQAADQAISPSDVEPPTALSSAMPARPNIVFISLDTVRRDAIGVYSGETPSPTPHIDAFAGDAVRFRNAYAPMPFTLPSHMTMLTGLYPDAHGVNSHNARLGDDVVTLAERLHAVGYATYGLVTNHWMKGDFGFDRGFDHYEQVRHAPTYADRVRLRAFELLDDHPPHQPFFLFLHLLDAHSDFQKSGRNLPYRSPEAFRSDLDISDDDPRFCDQAGRCATEFLLAADHEGRQVDPALIEMAGELYDRGIRYLDSEIGLLFEELERRGLYRPTLIVLVSDHGEEFRDHGRFLHDQPYEENVAVPFLIKLPAGARAGDTIDALVGHVDLMPTFVDLLDLSSPKHGQGTSLLPLLDGRSVESRHIMAQDKREGRYAVRGQRYKLIHDYREDLSELYDLDADPSESSNLADSLPAVRDDLRQHLDTLVRHSRDLATSLKAPDATDGVLTAEERASLRAIGYVN